MYVGSHVALFYGLIAMIGAMSAVCFVLGMKAVK